MRVFFGSAFHTYAQSTQAPLEAISQIGFGGRSLSSDNTPQKNGASAPEELLRLLRAHLWDRFCCTIPRIADGAIGRTSPEKAKRCSRSLQREKRKAVSEPKIYPRPQVHHESITRPASLKITRMRQPSSVRCSMRVFIPQRRLCISVR